MLGYELHNRALCPQSSSWKPGQVEKYESAFHNQFKGNFADSWS